MRKRKPLFPVDDKSKKRSVRFNSNAASQSQSRRGILPYNPQKNSDDEFSMASWEQRALESSKTPKMNNLTTSSEADAATAATAAAATCVNGNTGFHGRAAQRKPFITSRTVPPTKMKSIPEHHDMDMGQIHVEKPSRSEERTKARKFPEDSKQSSFPKPPNAKQLSQTHQILPPQQKTNSDHTQHATKSSNGCDGEETNYYLNQNKVSIRPSSSSSKPKKDDIPSLTPRRRTKSGAILPADNHTTKHPATTIQKASVRDRSVVDKKTDSMNGLSSNKNVESDVDDMDCDSSGGSCLESTSSSSEASSLTSSKIDTDGAHNPSIKDAKTSSGKFHLQEDDGTTQKYKSTERSTGKDYHRFRQLDSTLSVPVLSANHTSTQKKTRFLDDEHHNRARESRPDNNDFFQKMMNSETPVTAKRNNELLGSTVGADGHFVLHDDDSDITSLSRASKTPKRKLFPYPSSIKKKDDVNSGDETTPPLIDNLLFLDHHEDNRALNGGKDIDEESIEAWSVDGNTTLPFEFTVDGKNYAHPALPPGWKMRLSKTQKKPVYIHPDHGRTWYCPVVLPHHSMNMVYARSSLRSMDNAEEDVVARQTRTHNKASATPPSPPSSTVSNKESYHVERRLNRTKEASARKKRMTSISVLETVHNPHVRPANQRATTVKSKKKTPPSVLEKSPTYHQKRPKTPPFQSHLRELTNKTPIGNDENTLPPKSLIEDARREYNTPGTMSDLLRSYEHEKKGTTSGEFLSSGESGSLSGYECDDPGETESSSSLSSRKDPTLRCKSTPRHHDKLLSSKLCRSRSKEQKLSPIDEAQEKPTDDANQLTEIQTPGRIKGNEYLSDQDADAVDNPFETPCSHGVEKKEDPPRNETSSQSHTDFTESKQRKKDSDQKVSSSFRTPKSQSASENEESGDVNRSGQIIEVAVLRHGSSRRKKRQTPLLSSDGNKNGAKKSSGRRGFAGSTGEKFDRKSPHSPLISTNEDWSPLPDQQKTLNTQELVDGQDKSEKSCPRNHDDSVMQSIENSVSVNTPTAKDLHLENPNESGFPPGSADTLSVDSPLRPDIQTPAFPTSNRKEEECLSKDPKDNQVKPTPAAGVEHSLEKSHTEKNQDDPPSEEPEKEERNKEDGKEAAAVASASPVVFDACGDDFSEGSTGIPSRSGSKLSANKNASTNTREAVTMKPESPVVFDTYGDDFSEGSNKTPHQSTPTSPERKTLSSIRSIRSVNKSAESPGSPSPNAHVDSDETEDILSSENENDGTDISGRSFEIEQSKSPYGENSFMNENSTRGNHRLGRSKFGWRVLHPPHPICCLQRLDEILSKSRKTKSTKKRVEKTKKKPRKSYGAKRTAD